MKRGGAGKYYSFMVFSLKNKTTISEHLKQPAKLRTPQLILNILSISARYYAILDHVDIEAEGRNQEAEHETEAEF